MVVSRATIGSFSVLGRCENGAVRRLLGDHTELTPLSHPTTPALRIELLGPMRVFLDGSAVEIPGLLRRAVLARLAIARGEVVVVEALIDAVWPNVAPDHARKALHSHLWRIRRHLGEHAERLERSSA